MSPNCVKCPFCDAEPGYPCWVHFCSSHIGRVLGNDANITRSPQVSTHPGYPAGKPHRQRVKRAERTKRSTNSARSASSGTRHPATRLP